MFTFRIGVFARFLKLMFRVCMPFHTDEIIAINRLVILIILQSVINSVAIFKGSAPNENTSVRQESCCGTINPAEDQCRTLTTTSFSIRNPSTNNVTCSGIRNQRFDN